MLFEQDKKTHLMPVAVYSKKYIDALYNEIKEAKKALDSGEQPVFDSVDTLLDALDNLDR